MLDTVATISVRPRTIDRCIAADVNDKEITVLTNNLLENLNFTEIFFVVLLFNVANNNAAS